MAKIKAGAYVKLTGHKCYRCGHEWLPRKRVVKVCPKCKNVYWNVPKEK